MGHCWAARCTGQLDTHAAHACSTLRPRHCTSGCLAWCVMRAQPTHTHHTHLFAALSHVCFRCDPPPQQQGTSAICCLTCPYPAPLAVMILQHHRTILAVCAADHSCGLSQQHCTDSSTVLTAALHCTACHPVGTSLQPPSPTASRAAGFRPKSKPKSKPRSRFWPRSRLRFHSPQGVQAQTAGLDLPCSLLVIQP